MTRDSLDKFARCPNTVSPVTDVTPSAGLINLEDTDPERTGRNSGRLAAGQPRAHGLVLERGVILPGSCPGFLLLRHS